MGRNSLKEGIIGSGKRLTSRAGSLAVILETYMLNTNEYLQLTKSSEDDQKQCKRNGIAQIWEFGVHAVPGFNILQQQIHWLAT